MRDPRNVTTKAAEPRRRRRRHVAAWVRAGLEATGGVVKRIVGMLGIHDTPASEEQVGPFRIVESGPDVIHLETTLPLMRVVMVGRGVEPRRRVLTTFLYFRRPLLARIVWVFVGLGHRRTAPKVLTAKTD
ncbi:hypothetical protein [Actinokineospora alba]|uniref:hypothetical protein n=1 Tax=Actinokineospora alba TaxID=504798 RepID=UPI00105DBCD7|nr:hypothetical protein [Actinokineospora alba]